MSSILFNHAITKVIVRPKYSPWDSHLTIVENFKKRVGRKFLIIPIYEIVPVAVTHWWTEEFLCEAKDLPEYRSKLYVENGEIYENPFCLICMNDQSSEKIYFPTEEALNEYVETLKSQAPHIIINPS
jgi:hypothetical protein